MNRRWLYTALTVIASAGFGTMAYAANPGNPATFDGTADVEIVDLISITEDDQNLVFGSIVPPEAGDEDFTVNAQTGAMTEELMGSGGEALGGQARGVYDITGSNIAYDLTVTDGSCSDAGLDLHTMRVSIEGAAGVATPAASTLDDLNTGVGGTLNVAAGVPGGPHTCSYTITAEY